MTSAPINSVKKALDYIEHNLKNNITLDDISQNVNLSKYHLNRLFKAATNLTPLEYVRGRKLSSSIHELLNTNLKIIDIATEYSFRYEQSYIRSFINLFNTSPDKFRKERPTIEITDKYDPSFLKPTGNDGIIFEPKILIKPKFKIVGLEYLISISENKKSHVLTELSNDFFYNHRQKIKNPKNPEVYYGYIHFSDYRSDEKFYVTSIEVSSLDEIPDGMKGYCVPSRKYAAFKYIGFHHPNNITISNLENIYSYISMQWFSTSNYQPSDCFQFERVDMSHPSKDYCELDIYIPVELKESSKSSIL
jgi:AraC family transcriptional regulator